MEFPSRYRILKVDETKKEFKYTHKDHESAIDQRDQLRDEGIYSTIEPYTGDGWIVIVKISDIIDAFRRSYSKVEETDELSHADVVHSNFKTLLNL
jgi:hypothetical protein